MFVWECSPDLHGTGILIRNWSDCRRVRETLQHCSPFMFCQTSSERTCGFNCAQRNFGHWKNLMGLLYWKDSLFLINDRKIIWACISKIKMLNDRFGSKTQQQPNPVETCIVKTSEQQKTIPQTLLHSKSTDRHELLIDSECNRKDLNLNGTKCLLPPGI